MLRDYDLWLTLPALDLERAKAFYRDVLGFEPVLETDAWLTYRSGASIFRLYPTPSAGTAQHTLAGWVVDDLERAVAEQGKSTANGLGLVAEMSFEDVRLDPAATDERAVVCQSLRHTAP